MIIIGSFGTTWRRALVYGIPRRPFVRKLQGAGITLGVRFRAGCFYPFWRKDVALLTGRTVAAREVFGPDADRWLAAVLDAEPGAEPDEARNTVPGAWCNTVLDPRFEPAKAAAMARAAEAALLPICRRWIPAPSWPPTSWA